MIERKGRRPLEERQARMRERMKRARKFGYIAVTRGWIKGRKRR